MQSVLIKATVAYLALTLIFSLCGCRRTPTAEIAYSSTERTEYASVISDVLENDIPSEIQAENEALQTPEAPSVSADNTTNKPSTAGNLQGFSVNTVTEAPSILQEAPSQEVFSAEFTPFTDAEIKQVEDYFFQLVNEERVRVGVQPLTRNATLDKAAKIRVDETLTNFSHTRPNGTNYFTVLTELKYGIPHEDIWSDDGINWNTTISYDYGASGENLAGDYNTSKRTLQELSRSFFDSFRHSAGHYQNMISSNFNYTGISVNSYIENNAFKCDIIHIFTEK